MKLIVIGLTAAALAGCSTTGEYRDYLTAQHESHKLALHGQKPLVEIEAVEGQAITGLRAVRVFAPAAAPQIAQPRANEWAGVVGQGLGVLGALGGVWLGGEAAKGLAHTVGAAAGQGYQYVNPTPIVAPGTTVVRPEVVQPVVVTTPPPQVVPIPTQVIDQPIVVPVPTAGGL